MNSKNNVSFLQELIVSAKNGTEKDIDYIMGALHINMTIAESKFIDFALSHVENDKGIRRLEYYLFSGTKIQRNYCTLYFNRNEAYEIVSDAYKKGLIDYKQAFSR